ncbi:MAG TPA: 16S rRNA (guanine(966)-N(2))-methyltransferase RsmD [Acidimicrobiales bacterium]|jgi:16S rRNA (guanine966-N2)-methyltransferase|nr:16S rRNA (guanine(966)-N(2))-methyltransferase RsmD [Acidimicrobiales bacterium]
MRIVAGTARGRKLTVPSNSKIRPTKDRVREAIFNSLHSHGLVEDLRYLDLFAGTGSLGLEALSRGANSVVFVDNNELSINTITHNLQMLEFDSKAEVRHQDAVMYLKEKRDFDVAILDPPYEFGLWNQLLSQIKSKVVVIETSQIIALDASWSVIKEQNYGQSKVLIAKK